MFLVALALDLLILPNNHQTLTCQHSVTNTDQFLTPIFEGVSTKLWFSLTGFQYCHMAVILLCLVDCVSRIVYVCVVVTSVFVNVCVFVCVCVIMCVCVCVCVCV